MKCCIMLWSKSSPPRCVTSSCLHFEDAILNRQQTDIESATSEVEDEHILFASILFAQAVRNCSCCWFVNYAEHVQTGDATGVLGGVALTIIEIGRYGDHSILDFIS